MPRGFDHLHVVHRRERLQRGVRPRALHHTTFPGRRIKNLHRRWGGRSFPIGVKTAAVELIPFVLNEFWISPEAYFRPQTRGLVGLYTGSAHFGIENPGQGKSIVPDDLRLKTKSRSTGQKNILGVIFDIIGSKSR